MRNDIKMAIESYFGKPIPADIDEFEHIFNLLDIVGVVEQYAAQHGVHPTGAGVGDFEEDDVIRPCG